MEQNPQNAIINIPHTTTHPPNYHDEPKPNQLLSRKKKHGPMHAIRVALFMMRGRSKKSKVLPVDDESKSVWRKIVGSMRPLHLQSNQSPRHPQTNGQPLKRTLLPSPSFGDVGDEAVTPASDFPVEEAPYSPSPPSSRYASAIGLNELVQSDDDNEKPEMIVEEEECKESGVGDGDELIDAKADEFIAQFYKEMRLQRLDLVDHCYKERSQRSLGW